MRALILFFFFAQSIAQAADINVAVAANFSAPIKIIAAAFEKESGHKANIIIGSTGALYAQIKNGAPLDVFLAADDSTPIKLEQENASVLGSRFTYAQGKLALWSKNESTTEALNVQLQKGQFKYLALANPKLAPYGQAAMETLEKLGLKAALANKIVLGNNITQAYQFVDTGNAELGFVALSQVWKDNKPSQGGRVWLVPETYYTPILQDAVLLKTGKENPVATAFLAYLKGSAAQSIIKEYGYALP